MLLKTIWLTSLTLSIAAIIGFLLLYAHRYRVTRRDLNRAALINQIAEKVTHSHQTSDIQTINTLLLKHIRLLPMVYKSLATDLRKPTLSAISIDALLARLSDSRRPVDPLVKAKILNLFPYDSGISDAFYALLSAPYLARNMSAIWLIKHQPILDITQFIDLLCQSDKPPIRKIIDLLRAKIHDDQQWLAILAKGHHSRALILTALECLNDTIDSTQQQQVIPYLTHEDADVRAQAWRAVARNRYTEATSLVAGLADEGVWYVRTQMIYAAGVLRCTEVMPLLQAALYSDIWWERYRAAQAIVTLSGIEGLQPYLAVGDRAGRITQALLSETSEAQVI